LRRHHLHPVLSLQHVDRSEGVADIAGQHFLAGREALSTEAEIDIGLVGKEAPGRLGAFLPGLRDGQQQRGRPGTSAQFLFDAVAVAAEAGQRQADCEGAVVPQFVALADQPRGPAEFGRSFGCVGRNRKGRQCRRYQGP
jgi:hypothetical protein